MMAYLQQMGRDCAASMMMNVHFILSHPPQLCCVALQKPIDMNYSMKSM